MRASDSRMRSTCASKPALPGERDASAAGAARDASSAGGGAARAGSSSAAAALSQAAQRWMLRHFTSSGAALGAGVSGCAGCGCPGTASRDPAAGGGASGLAGAGPRCRETALCSSRSRASSSSSPRCNAAQTIISTEPL